MNETRKNLVERNGGSEDEPSTIKSPENLSVIRPYGYSVSKCGYCKGSRSKISQENESSTTSHSLLNSSESTSHSNNASSMKISLSSKSYSVLADSISPSLYEGLIHRGWRRSGLHLYKPQNFSSCCPALATRLLTKDFKPSKSQRKVLKKMENIFRSQKRHMQGKQHLLATGKTDVSTSLVSMPTSSSKKQKRNHSEKYKANVGNRGKSLNDKGLFSHLHINTANMSTSSVSSIEEQVTATGVLERLEEVTINALEKYLSSASIRNGRIDIDQLRKHECNWKTSYRILPPSKRERKQFRVRAVSSICAQISGQMESAMLDGRMTRELLVERVVKSIREGEDVLSTPNKDIENYVIIHCNNHTVSVKSIEAHLSSGQIICTIQVEQAHFLKNKNFVMENNQSENDIAMGESSSKEYGKMNKETKNNKYNYSSYSKLAHWYERTTGKTIDLDPDDDFLTIELLPAHQSALNPNVHRLYAQYQHAVHNDPNPFSNDHHADTENGNDGRNDGEDEELMLEIDDPSELDWGDAPSYFTDKISTMLSAYIQSIDSKECRRAVLSSYYSFYQFLVEAPFPVPNVSNKLLKILSRDGRGVQQMPGLSFNENSDCPPSPLPCGLYHQHYILGGDVLIAVGVIDVLPSGLSSVYLFYHPSFSYELVALGKYAILKEIEFARDVLKVPYYYLGYYIESCQKMRYKVDYKPTQILCPMFYDWVDAPIAIPKLQKTLRHVCPLSEPIINYDEVSNETKSSNLDTQKTEDGNKSIVEALNVLQMDIGAGMNVTVDMLHSTGVEVVKPILKEFISEFSPALSKKCILKLT